MMLSPAYDITIMWPTDNILPTANSPYSYSNENSLHIYRERCGLALNTKLNPGIISALNTKSFPGMISA